MRRCFRLLKPVTRRPMTRTRLSSLSTVPSSFASLLRQDQIAIFNEERVLFDDLHTLLQVVEAPQDVIDLVVDTKSRVDDVYMVVVVGEFNAGKSTFINALLGAKHLEEGVLPTTTKICILRNSGGQKHSQFNSIWRRAENMMLDDVVELELPLAWLDHIAIIDTPGTNAVNVQHERLTTKIVPRADLVLFVTSAERPVSDSEASFLKKISQWGKKVVVIVNKMDVVSQAEDRYAIMDYVTQNVAKVLGTVRPVPVFGISGREALRAKLMSQELDPSLGPAARTWEQSNLNAVEKYLHSVLAKEEIVKSKLENPMIVADRVLVDSLRSLKDRLEMLETDVRVLETVDASMKAFNSDMDRDVKYYRLRIDKLLTQLLQSTDRFLEENISIFKPKLLYDSNLFNEEFKRHVIFDVSRPVEEIFTEISELVAERARLQARTVLEYIGTRPRRISNNMLGHVQDAHFDIVRADMLHGFRKDLEKIGEQHDHGRDVARASKSVRESFIASSAVQAVSAVSLGGLFAAQLLDITGLTALTSAALASLLIVPWRRSSVRKEFEKNLKTLQTQLDAAVSNQFESGKSKANEKIIEAIAPYSRFVKLEKDKVNDVTARMEALRVAVRNIKSKLK